MLRTLRTELKHPYAKARRNSVKIPMHYMIPAIRFSYQNIQRLHVAAYRVHGDVVKLLCPFVPWPPYFPDTRICRRDHRPRTKRERAQRISICGPGDFSKEFQLLTQQLLGVWSLSRIFQHTRIRNPGNVCRRNAKKDLSMTF